MYGHPRTFRQNTSLVTNLLDRYPGDMFVHLFPMHDLGPHQVAWHPDRAGSAQPVTEDDVRWIYATYPRIKKFELAAHPYSTYYVPEVASKFGGRYSGARAQSLRREFERDWFVEYDIVFRLRFDLVFNEPFVMPEKIDPGTLYGAYNLTAIENCVDDDLFNYGSPHVIDSVFGEAFPDRELANMEGYGFQGEALVTSIRKFHGFKYASHAPMKCGLLRSTGLMEIRI